MGAAVNWRYRPGAAPETKPPTPPDLTALSRPAGADLFRAFAVGLVGWFHIWQQTWISPGRMEPMVRTGYVWVDAMILLSAFCLWLPYARARLEGRPFPGCRGFWRRRAVRILPSYWFCVLVVMFFFALPDSGWSPRLAWDFFSHMTLLHTLHRYSYLFTELGGVLWTVGVLAGFYLLFPLIGRAFWQRPCLTFAGLCAAQAAYTWGWALGLDDGVYPMVFNQLPGFLGVWALGMAGAEVYLRLAAAAKPAARWLAVPVIPAALWVLYQMQTDLMYDAAIQRWQLAWRLPLTAVMCLLLGAVCLLPALPGRRLWAFLSGISYNFYLWHQTLAVWLKYRWRIPAWTGDVPPNQLWDAAWMAGYDLWCWGAALAAAVAGTYLIEKPAARRLKSLLFGTDVPAKRPKG